MDTLHMMSADIQQQVMLPINFFFSIKAPTREPETTEIHIFSFAHMTRGCTLINDQQHIQAIRMLGLPKCLMRLRPSMSYLSIPRSPRLKEPHK